MRMPWDPPEPPQKDRKTRQAKKEETARSSTTERKQRQPRKPRNTYDLYGAPPMTDEVDGYVNSAMEAAGEHHGKARQSKLGIILIDHGSKKQSSNDALHSIAERYEAMLQQRLQSSSDSSEVSLAVRAGHMEIAPPSIESALRSIIDDGATKVICVPYFLSRGRHITIDVPNLIEDAKDVLEDEGLLNGVEIETSKHLGSDVDSMIEAVDDLVKGMIKDENDFSWMQSGVSGEVVVGKDQDSVHDELRKYTNRSKLLENMLEKKVQQLKTMTNRVTILEDVLNKKLEENDRLREKHRAAAGDVKRKNSEASAAADPKEIAKLSGTIDALKSERSELLNQVKDLEADKAELEESFSTSKSDLMSKISALETEIKEQNEANAVLQANLTTSQQLQQNQTLGEQQDTINDLRTQLAELLDAYNELEQLQNETETSVEKYQLENERLTEDLNSKSEEYQRKLDDSQILLDEEKAKSLEVLEESRKDYEKLLAKEQDEAAEWKEKYNDLVAEQSKDMAAVKDARSDEEWAKLEFELKEALDASSTAETKIQELEKQAQQQQDDNDSTSSLQKELDQQQQLQEYLKAQIQTYYETIQEQSEALDEYKKQIKDMQKKHDDSMLIATNSVDASQRREEDLLNHVEELENELDEVQKEKSDIEQKLKELQGQLNVVSRSSQQVKGETDSENMRLSIEIEGLRRDLDAALKEKERILAEKVRLEQVIVDSVIGEDHKSDEIPGQIQPKRSRLQYLLRPWTILKRQ